MRSKVRAYSHQGHGPRADQQAGYISATSDSTASLANGSRSIHVGSVRRPSRGREATGETRRKLPSASGVEGVDLQVTLGNRGGVVARRSASELRRSTLPELASGSPNPCATDCPHHFFAHACVRARARKKCFAVVPQRFWRVGG